MWVFKIFDEHIDYEVNIKKILAIKLRADTNLLKMVPVEILLNFGNYFRTLQLGF